MGRISTSKSTLIAYPGFGYRLADGSWHLCVAGIAVQNPDALTFRKRILVKMLGGMMKASREEMDGEIFQERIIPFVAEANVRQPIEIELAGRNFRLHKRTRRNGHFHEFLTLPETGLQDGIETDQFGNQFIAFQARLENYPETTSTSRVYLLNESGFSVVSDIDDTIKESHVGDRRLLLTNTFLKEFRSVDGMSQVYRQLAETGASFHYVSSSPWQLFESLLEMKVNHDFPPGTIHLRNFRLRDQIFHKVMLRRPGKMTAIRFLLDHLPSRAFILIGDSGEKDPEIYAKICRKYPQQVRGLFIREVEHRPLDLDRWQKIKYSLPQVAVEKFHNAHQLQQLLDDRIQLG